MLGLFKNLTTFHKKNMSYVHGVVICCQNVYRYKYNFKIYLTTVVLTHFTRERNITP